jgi:hypothetical protein
VAERPAVAHVAHDELLIAAWVSGDTEPAEAARAADLASRCDDCRELASDLRGLRAAVRALPTPARRRDFRLTPADAERLRSRPGWLDRLRAVRSATLTRPLAGAMTALGLAGLLLTSAPLGGAGVGGADRDTATFEAQVSAGDDGMGTAASAAAAPGASIEAAAGTARPMPVAASGGQELAASPVPGDAGATAPGGEEGPDIQASVAAVAQATAPSGVADEPTLRVAAPPTTPSPTDLARPALGVASAALLVSGLLLLFVTRRRGARTP